jgi:hypothetical protein
VLLLASLLAYALYQVRSGLGRRFLNWSAGSAGSNRPACALAESPRRDGETTAGGNPAARPRPTKDTGNTAMRSRRWRRLDLRLYWLAFGLLLLAATTGALQFLGSRFAPPALIEALHRLAAWGLVAYLCAHVALQLAGGGPRRLLTILLPRAAFIRAGAAAGVVGLVLALALIGANGLALPALALSRTDQAPILDGRAEDPVWQQARPARLRLANGANLPGGATDVTLRGLHDGERVYLLVEWTDPTRSAKHVPLLKTEDGWRILQTAYRDAAEDDYYEDKLALMLAPSNPLAALASIHLGSQPLAGQPGAPGGRGLHYTTDGSVLDVWHWKSVRHDNQRQADDNFFGPPLPAPDETPRRRDPDSGAWLPRYTAGYRKDPPGTYSGYEMNWEFFAEGPMLPLRLPDDPREVGVPDPAALAPGASDDPNGPGGSLVVNGWIEHNDTRPYADGPDELPVGTLLPSVLATGRLAGDRGHIAARGRWSDGRWTLELSRALDTGSPRDVVIGEGTLLWVAVFDHTQTRHAYHLRPLRIRLDRAVGTPSPPRSP